MSCVQYRQAIHDWVDGTLGSIRRAELESHLDLCDGCRTLANELAQVRDLAGSLDRPAPPARVWLQVAGRLHQEGRVQSPAPVTRSAWQHQAWMAIAAGLVLVVASLVFLMQGFGGGGDSDATGVDARTGGSTAVDLGQVQSIEEDFRLAEQHLQSGIARLEEAAESDQPLIDPETAATLQKNLEVIDQAIAESRAALKAQPQNALARNSLFDALRRKVVLLQDTIALMNEMRKGNAAGAAQVVEELNKS